MDPTARMSTRPPTDPPQDQGPSGPDPRLAHRQTIRRRRMVALGAVSALILAIVFVIVSISGNGSTPREGALPSASTALKAQGNSRTAPVAANSGGPKTSFGDGIHVVGTDIAPGTYSTGGGKGCYWELDTSLDGSTSAIAKDGTPAGSDTVRITNADKAFLTAGCGTWTLAN